MATNLHILEQVDIFQELSAEQLMRVDNICQEESYNEGDFIVMENARSDKFYIIMDGEVEILVDPDTIGTGNEDLYEPSKIAVLRWGQSFGEVSIVDPAVRSASARCGTESCKVLAIHRKDFVKLLNEDYQMGYIVMRNFAADLALRIRQTNLMVRESLSVKAGK